MLKQLTLTVISENRVNNPKLLAEQGLSIYCETNEGTLLFDTGQMHALVHNARQLQLDFKAIRYVVLSHGHFDMAGGLRHLLKEVSPLNVICHPNLFNKKYRVIDGERMDIGVPWERMELEEQGARFILKAHPTEILPDIWISGEIPRLTDYEYIDETYQERILESYIHDELHDDMSLIFKTEKGLVVLMGCGHAGPVNTLKHAMRITQTDHIHAIIGGMHLHRAPLEKIERIVANLKKLDPDYLIPLHCCGFRAINQMFNVFKERVLLFNVGDRFRLNL